MNLGEISIETGLPPATVRRLLLCLIKYNFVEQDRKSRHYFIGLGLFTLAATTANKFDMPEARRTTLMHMTRRTGVASAIFVRDGDDMVCLDCVHPSAAATAVDIGTRIPIGLDPFGIVYASRLRENIGDNIIARNLRRYVPNVENTAHLIADKIRDARQNNFLMECNPFQRRWSITTAIVDRDGLPESVIGIVAASELPNDFEALIPIVTGEARTLQNLLWRTLVPMHQPGQMFEQ